MLATLTLLLAGCASPNVTRGGGGLAPVIDPVEYRATPHPINGHDGYDIFLIHPDWRADRLTYEDDHSSRIALAPGIQYDEATFALILDPAHGGNMNRSTGGLLVRVETGTISKESFSRLMMAGPPEWPTNPISESPIEYVRFGSSVDIVRGPPFPNSFSDTIAAMDAAEASFVATRTQVATAPQPTGPATEPCLEPAVSVAGTLQASATGFVTITSTARNCGSHTLTVDTSGCTRTTFWAIAVVPPGGPPSVLNSASRTAQPLTAPPPPNEKNPVSLPQPEPCSKRDDVTIAPGETATLTRQWNGSYYVCEETACYLLESDDGWAHASVLFSTPPDDHGRASPEQAFLVMRQERRIVPLLVVIESDWLNATDASQSIGGNYGGHCAPARYTTDPVTLTIYYLPNQTVGIPSGAILRDFHGAPHPNTTYTVSADGLDYVSIDQDVKLASPFYSPNATRTILNVTRANDSFAVNGVNLLPGTSTTVHVQYDFDEKGIRYHAAHELVVRNVGPASTFFEERGLCA